MKATHTLKASHCLHKESVRRITFLQTGVLFCFVWCVFGFVLFSFPPQDYLEFQTNNQQKSLMKNKCSKPCLTLQQRCQKSFSHCSVSSNLCILVEVFQTLHFTDVTPFPQLLCFISKWGEAAPDLPCAKPSLGTGAAHLVAAAALLSSPVSSLQHTDLRRCVDSTNNITLTDTARKLPSDFILAPKSVLTLWDCKRSSRLPHRLRSLQLTKCLQHLNFQRVSWRLGLMLRQK